MAEIEDPSTTDVFTCLGSDFANSTRAVQRMRALKMLRGAFAIQAAAADHCGPRGLRSTLAVDLALQCEPGPRLEAFAAAALTMLRVAVVNELAREVIMARLRVDPGRRRPARSAKAIAVQFAIEGGGSVDRLQRSALNAFVAHAVALVAERESAQLSGRVDTAAGGMNLSIASAN